MTLGRFELTGILPAPRGVPQIEVTFDIDANGIVNVSAKDMGSGKEQSIRITASSGLSETDIQNLIKEADSHAEDDRKKKEAVDLRNQADTLIYSTEKSLADLGDKVDAAVRADLESKIEDLKKVVEGEDLAIIRTNMDNLAQASHKLAEQLYAQKAGGAQAGGADEPPHETPHGDQDDVVDADYTEVK